MEDIFEKLVCIMVDEFCLDKDGINIDSNFRELGLDELDIADLLMSVEETFNIEVLDEEFGNVDNIDKLVKLIFKVTKKDFE